MGLFDKLTRKNQSSADQFYLDCLKDFHATALEHGFANHGVVFIPELIPYGERTVLAYLKDSFFQSQFGKNPAMYYYVIMSLSLQAGIAIAAKWHFDFSALQAGYVSQIIEEGPADECKPFLAELELADKEDENAFYSAIFERWSALHEPYWELKDPREYTFKAMLAAYQLGISVILEKYGF